MQIVFTISFNKWIKVLFDLTSVNKSWSSTYYLQNSSYPKNTKLITYKSSRGFSGDIISVLIRTVHFFQWVFNSVVPNHGYTLEGPGVF